MRNAILIGLIVSVAVFAVGCESTQKHDHSGLKANGGWCNDCSVGYVKGVEYSKRCCYDAAAQGKACMAHAKSGATLYMCESCGRTSQSPGNCATCGRTMIEKR